MMNHFRDIIKTPIMTEKSANVKEDNSYVFKVDAKANKTEIKQAIEALFKVKVVSVNTVNVKAKKKVRGRVVGYTSKYKKAYVKLAPDNDIELN